MPEVVTNDGVALHYEERGEGRPLPVVPGWGMSVCWFAGELLGLSDRIRVIVFDPRGSGNPDKESEGQRVGSPRARYRGAIAGLGFSSTPPARWPGGDWSNQISTRQRATCFPQFFVEPLEEADLASMVEETLSCDQISLDRISWNVLNQDYRDVPEKVGVPTLVVQAATTW
jgi:hypothetical protein